MNWQNYKFITSVFDYDYIVEYDIPEIAFIGRSNVGKSSLINALLRNKKIAKVSSKPGKTISLNFFDIDDKFHLVDLPGYGYSRSGKQLQKIWEGLLDRYLQNRIQLKFVFLIIDAKVGPTERDINMKEYFEYYNINIIILANKIDKIPKTRVNTHIKKIAEKLNTNDIIPISAKANTNIAELKELVEKKLEI